MQLVKIFPVPLQFLLHDLELILGFLEFLQTLHFK
jgi:hypothetical protein